MLRSKNVHRTKCIRFGTFIYFLQKRSGHSKNYTIIYDNGAICPLTIGLINIQTVPKLHNLAPEANNQRDRLLQTLYTQQDHKAWQAATVDTGSGVNNGTEQCLCWHSHVFNVIRKLSVTARKKSRIPSVTLWESLGWSMYLQCLLTDVCSKGKSIGSTWINH